MLRKLLGKLGLKKSYFRNSPSEEQDKDFLTLLDNLLEENGIELPSIPENQEREAYLDFLSLSGYKEEELLPVIDRQKLTGEMYGATITGLLSAIQSKDKNLLKATAWIAKNTITGIDNTNLIIYELMHKLQNELINSGISIPTCYAGVFPTDSCNAQARVHNGSSLILIDTGYMEMIEGVVTCLFSEEHDNTKATELNSVVEKYVIDRQRPSAISFSTKGVDWGGGIVPIVVNSVEEFILSHEIAHLVLGHVSENSTTFMSPRFSDKIEVCEKDANQEFSADLWASKHLVERIKLGSDKDEKIMLAIGGATIALGVGLLVESSKKKAGLLPDATHPPAFERMYMLEILWEILGVVNLSGIAKKFKELLSRCIDNYYPGADMPPFLDRELNRKLVPVLDALKIKYDQVEFLNY